MAKITITIDREIWKKLMEFKINHEDLRTFEEIIDYLLNNQKTNSIK